MYFLKLVDTDGRTDRPTLPRIELLSQLKNKYVLTPYPFADTPSPLPCSANIPSLGLFCILSPAIWIIWVIDYSSLLIIFLSSTEILSLTKDKGNLSNQCRTVSPYNFYISKNCPDLYFYLSLTGIDWVSILWYSCLQTLYLKGLDPWIPLSWPL